MILLPSGQICFKNLVQIVRNTMLEIQKILFTAFSLKTEHHLLSVMYCAMPR